jgi:hypothetical protein
VHRITAAAARIRAAAAAAARWAMVAAMGASVIAPPTILGPVLPRTPPPPPRQLGPWRPRIRPELRTVRERVIIYYLTADVPVAAALAVAGWPVGDPL